MGEDISKDDVKIEPYTEPVLSLEDLFGDGIDRSLKEFRLLPRLTDEEQAVDKVSLETKLCCIPGTKDHLKLSIPLLSAAMYDVSGKDMAIGLAQHGGLSVIPRSYSIEEQVRIINEVKRTKGGFQQDVMTVAPNTPLSEVKDLMDRHGYGKFPVTYRGQPKGKLLGLITGLNFHKTNHLKDAVQEHMIQKPITAPETISLGEANDKMIEHGIDYLLIVNRKKRLRSMVFKKDADLQLDFPYSSIDKKKRYMVGAAVSTQDEDRDRIKELLKAEADVIFIDASDGHTVYQKNTLEYIKNFSEKTPTVAGNIITPEAFNYLADLADGFDVGMGIGSGCTTQDQKGTGRGQATALYHVCKARDIYNEITKRYIPIGSDGSIANSGEMLVALAIGADNVMCGRWFAQFTESAGAQIDHPQLGSVKLYRMEASAAIKNMGRYHSDQIIWFEEGVSGYVMHIGSLHVHLPKTILKLKSGLSTAGCENIEELHNRQAYILRPQSPTALLDAGVHGVIIEQAPLVQYKR